MTKSDYTKTLEVKAPRARLFEALVTLEGLRGWWTSRVSGSGKPGGDLRFEFDGLEEHIVMHVEEAKAPSRVEWSCVVHTELDEWEDTRPTFDLRESGAEGCELHFRHVGLTPKLACYEDCELGWDHFLGSLVAYVEEGRGAPFGSDRGKRKRE